MSVREQIMGLYDELPSDAFDIGKNLGLEIAAGIAEARERELMARIYALDQFKLRVLAVLEDFGSADDGVTANLILKAIQGQPEPKVLGLQLSGDPAQYVGEKQ